MKKLLLLPLSLIYTLFYFLWDSYWKITQNEGVNSKVISVGNITIGGSGKTSLVEYLAKNLKKKQLKTAIVAKGYKRPESESLEICSGDNRDWRKCGDEPAALARSLGDVKIYVDSSKTYAAQQASEDGFATVIVDDGFQHRRLKRDIDIVCIDGNNPFGDGYLIPAGILREPVKSLRRADAIVVFSDNIEGNPGIQDLPAEIPVFNARKIPRAVKSASGEIIDPQGKKTTAFCGIGNPESFKKSLNSMGADIVFFEKFRDHHRYSEKDINKIVGSCAENGSELAVTTLKDFVKLENAWPGDIRLFYLEIDVEIDREDEFIDLVLR